MVVGLSEGEVDTETLLDEEGADEKEFRRLVDRDADAESEKNADILVVSVGVIVLIADLVDV